LGGSAGDRFGRRRIFQLGLGGFAFASLLCALAPSAELLIAARLLQGIAAALLVPASLAIIGSSYSGAARGRAIGTWAGAAALTTALGPPLGGWLIDLTGWRAIFFVNVPVAILAWLLALKIQADDGSEAGRPLDWRGAGLAIVTLGLVGYGLIALGDGQRLSGLIALAAAVPSSWYFIRTEAQADAPMMPLSLFRNPAFAGTNGVTVLLYAALSGALFLLPFLLIETQGYSASAAGAAFLPFSVIMGLGSRSAGDLVERFGPRPPLIIGPSITASGFVLLGLSTGNGSYWLDVLPGLIAVGIGMTVTVAPLTTTVLDSAPKDKSGIASGINNAAARTGGLIAIASLGLAFGGTGMSSVEPATLPSAYRIVMLTAAGLAILSTLIAAATIGPIRR
jgi:EmrB/QacA subfamily drug resistance transporter